MTREAKVRTGDSGALIESASFISVRHSSGYVAACVAPCALVEEADVVVLAAVPLVLLRVRLAETGGHGGADELGSDGLGGLVPIVGLEVGDPRAVQIAGDTTGLDGLLGLAR
jgi:hypothetical protein